MYSSPNNPTCIQIFTKAPIDDYCKTRLIPYLGKKETLQFHMNMVETTIKTATKINNADVQLWCQPSKNHEFFDQLARKSSLTLYDQKGQTLGCIMNNAARYAAVLYNNIVQIGTDCPYIDAGYINSSITKLNNENHAVIGPANDGGYVLLAINNYFKEIYDDINWGTNKVLYQLEDNLRKLNIKYTKLATLSDIDTFDDYKLWING